MSERLNYKECRVNGLKITGKILGDESIPAAHDFETKLIWINAREVILKQPNYEQMRSVEGIAYMINAFFLTEFICMESCREGHNLNCKYKWKKYCGPSLSVLIMLGSLEVNE